LKISIVGGGSTYTPELVDGLLRRHTILPIETLCLMDIDATRLDIVGTLARRMVEAEAMPFRIHLTTDRAEAIHSASFVVAQIRVGGMQARREDERLGIRHGLVGQETTGIGGMAKALRTIPVMLEVAQDVARLAPDAFLINFSNPAGLITEALLRHSDAQAIGLCNIPWNARADIAEWLDLPGERLELDYVGLNHLSWIRGVSCDGRDLTDEMVEAFVRTLEKDDAPSIAPQIARAQKAWLNYYLRYYYHTAQVIDEQRATDKTRADRVIEIERELLDRYQEPTLHRKPKSLEKRGGAYYSEAATALMADLHGNTGATHVVSTRNQGAIPNLPNDIVVEVPCRITATGADPIATKPLAPEIWGLVCGVKACELLTVRAAVYGDREAARLALLAHPLGPDGDSVNAVLADLLETNRRLLPRFFPEVQA
jgi:6-phospho-beta-glucosidase